MSFIGTAPVSLPAASSSFAPPSTTPLLPPQTRAPVLPPHTYNPLPAVQVSHSPQAPPAFNPTPKPVPPPQTSNSGAAPFSSAGPLPEDNIVWFYENSASSKLSDKWLPFSPADSVFIETKFNEGSTERVKVMSGRYEIDLMDGTRHAQYWAEDPIKIRRGYYYGQVDGAFQPLSEECGEIIDSELQSGGFPKKVPLPGGSNAVMHNSQSVVYLPHGCNPDEQGYVPPGAPQMQFVRRNVRHNELGLRVPPSEPAGAACALILVACDGSAAESSVGLVDSFRNRLLDMRQSHFGHKQRIDILPIIWQGAHSEQLSGTSEVVKELSVSSIPRLREFSSAAIADVMFYSSPIYAQPMIESLTQQLETILGLYREKNTNFSGPVHLIGHGISGLMLFDLLQNQKEKKSSSAVSATIPSTCTSLKSQPESLSELLENLSIQSIEPILQQEQIDAASLLMLEHKDIESLGLPLGPKKKLLQYISSKKEMSLADITPDEIPEIGDFEEGMTVNVEYKQYDYGAGQPNICYPKLNFEPDGVFTFGSPTGLLLALRGTEELGYEFALPTCRRFYNVFHPMDPFAYRLEPFIVSPAPPKPSQVPHHKGRKRLHLELADNLGKAAVEFRTGLMSTMKSVMSTVKRAAGYDEDQQQAEQLANEMIQSARTRAESDTSSLKEDFDMGQLNSGERIDYQLQERPLEMFNEYMFAPSAHRCYWTSEDAALLILKQIYTNSAPPPLPSSNFMNVAPQASENLHH